MAETGNLRQLSIFLSYAQVDGTMHAEDFYQRLSGRSPALTPWYDSLIQPHRRFPLDIRMALASAEAMVVLRTHGWTRSSWCNREVLFALKNEIPIIVADLDSDIPDSVELIDLTPLDFVQRPDTAWERLFASLRQIAQRDDPPVGRRPRTKRPTARSSRARSDAQDVNVMPELPRIKFQDRVDKMDQLAAWLSGSRVRMALVVGEAGAGKTALLRELRDRLLGAGTSFVYLGVAGYVQVSTHTLIAGLAKAVTDERAARAMNRRLPNLQHWRDRLDSVLEALGVAPVVVAIDDADELLGADGRLDDHDLHSCIGELTRRSGHGVRLILTGKKAIEQLSRDREASGICDLESGLPPEEVRPHLRALDKDRTARLATASDDEVRRIGRLSEGNPRFLELVYFLRQARPSISVRETLKRITPDEDDSEVTPFTLLLQEVVSTLTSTDCRVIQALAIFGRPVPPEAVGYLLAEAVPALDAAAVLDDLQQRHLVRRDGDRYFLPPEPDNRCVLLTVPPGHPEDWRRLTIAFTRPLLRARAAGYYAAESQKVRDRITTPRQLQPRIDEIALRIAAGGWEQAINVMESVDDEYLTPWGMSRVLDRWRLMIDKQIGPGRPRAANLSYLIAARDGEEDHDGQWVARLAEVMAEQWCRESPSARVKLEIQLAGVHMDSGRLTLAAEQFGKAAGRARRQGPPMRYPEAMARTANGLCLARLGRTEEAAHNFAQAWRLLPKVEDPDAAAELRATLVLNESWSLGQGDGAEVAISRLTGCLADIREGEQLLRGRLLDGLAALRCDSKDGGGAVEVAREAADIGLRSGNIALAREANVTLALAYLIQRTDAVAASAVDAALLQPASIHLLGAWVVRGIVSFRQGNMTRAATEFHRACTEAWLRLDREPDEYACHDTAALALTGLALTGETNRLPRALEEYRTARRIMSGTGARRRAAAQLGLFGERANNRLVEEARRAANAD